jgi:hypothetical protein
VSLVIWLWWQPWLAAQGEAGERNWWVAIVNFPFLMVLRYRSPNTRDRGGGETLSEILCLFGPFFQF